MDFNVDEYRWIKIRRTEMHMLRVLEVEPRTILGKMPMEALNENDLAVHANLFGASEPRSGRHWRGEL